MLLKVIPLSVFITFTFCRSMFAQVIDVNNDGTVGAEEAIAVAEQWKGPASRQNDHTHLGQTWIGNGNKLTIRGNYPGRLVIGPAKAETKGTTFIPSAPLILDNTAYDEDSIPLLADLIVGGTVGVVAAVEESDSRLRLVSNSYISLRLDSNDQHDFSSLIVYDGRGAVVASIGESGGMFLHGDLNAANVKSKIDHPVDPANKYLTHSSVESPEMMNVYSGNAVLDDNGEAVVELPDYFEAFNTHFRYQLTPIGASAPNLYVAEKIKNNSFTIAGGKPNQEISWMVTGIRQDAYAKANPVEVEQEKLGEEKGKYLHPALFGEPVEKSVGLVQRFQDE